MTFLSWRFWMSWMKSWAVRIIFRVLSKNLRKKFQQGEEYKWILIERGLTLAEDDLLLLALQSDRLGV